MSRPIVLIDEINQVVTTIFEDGAQLHAAPNYDPESQARAQALGYYKPNQWLDTGKGLMADALWAMTKDHEQLHHLVAEALGDTESIALWYAAHPHLEMNVFAQAQAHDEERIVLLIQRLLNQGLEP